MLKTLFAASTLTLAAACLTPALADDGKLVRSISLSGHGEMRMAPDLAIVTVGVMSSAATAREAGKLRIEGKQYVVKDGDVVEFRFNV